MSEIDLGAKADDLGRRVTDLTDAVEALATRTSATERRSSATVALIVALAGIVVLLGLVAWQSLTVAGRVDRITQNSLCPTFALVLGGFAPDSRPAGPARDAYVESFRQMTAARDVLGCSGGLVPPREEGR